jgi:putative endonuclease
MPDYYIYIMSNRTDVLYIGITNNLDRRIAEHVEGAVPGFTQKYYLGRLVYFESYANAVDAIAREKQLKGWRREKKIKLIESLNPKWSDLSRSASRHRFAEVLRHGSRCSAAQDDTL